MPYIFECIYIYMDGYISCIFRYYLINWALRREILNKIAITLCNPKLIEYIYSSLKLYESMWEHNTYRAAYINTNMYTYYAIGVNNKS